MKILHLNLSVPLFFLLSGCQTVDSWSDSIGEHMPVIGQRCENWQCFTAAGQQASEEKIRQKQGHPVQLQTQQNQPVELQQ